MHRALDPAATETIQRLNHFFGKAVSVITNLSDPDVIVIGGGVGNSMRSILEAGPPPGEIHF